ncbi:TPA: hypothetical protein CPT95_00845 [Candidatus Gastranaerophilales bacterium HUM_15]|nr:MAG TPA: hypothetical protein CPT95_00845 [Candidatus Gastranaerophilales bacterium HUM_15]
MVLIQAVFLKTLWKPAVHLKTREALLQILPTEELSLTMVLSVLIKTKQKLQITEHSLTIILL